MNYWELKLKKTLNARDWRFFVRNRLRKYSTIKNSFRNLTEDMESWKIIWKILSRWSEGRKIMQMLIMQMLNHSNKRWWKRLKFSKKWLKQVKTSSPKDRWISTKNKKTTLFSFTTNKLSMRRIESIWIRASILKIRRYTRNRNRGS